MPRRKDERSGLPNLLTAGKPVVSRPDFCACWQDVLLARENHENTKDETTNRVTRCIRKPRFSFSYFDLSCFRDELRAGRIRALYPGVALDGTPAATKVRDGAVRPPVASRMNR